jgi:putative hydrolase of HD superfamily
MATPDINRLIDLQKLLLTFSQIERIIHREHHGKIVQENDTEHSYNLTMTAWFLSQYFPELDKDLLIRYALAHDMVEVHAGDTYVFADAATLASKTDREHAAFKQLQTEWHDFPDLLEAIESYEKRESPEAKFVYALDKIIPVMTILINDGYTWKHEHITPEQLDSIKRTKVALSPEISPYYDELYELFMSNRQLFDAKSDKKPVQ